MDIAPTKPRDYVPPLLDRFLAPDAAEAEATRERPCSQQAASLAVLLRLLSDPTRLQLLILLAHGEQSVSALCEELRIPQPTVSHHLAWLRSSRLVAARRSGKYVFYSHGPAVASDGDSLSVGTVRIQFRGN